MQLIIWDFNKTLFNSKTKRLFPDALDILKYLDKKYIQILITTELINPRKRLQLIKSTGIEKYFKSIKISFKTKDVFLKAIRSENIDQEDVYVIGDGYFKEIQVGKIAGMKTIWVDRKNTIWTKIIKRDYWKKVINLEEIKYIL